MNKHTPGPWKVNGTVIEPDRPSFDAVATVQVSNVPSWEDNARLIAVAPELLEALELTSKALAAAFTGGEVSAALAGTALVKAGEAIAKARGES